ncbi:hypothetical protein [Rhodococcoides fascians]|uniref:hypothetical protein n=1 Tax=Rhodococcoides fascians TaxID=1828 RepID=UPI00055C2D7D|nr:hypothetical protein [Rhodococcus fascians]
METTSDRYRSFNEHVYGADAQAPSSIILALEALTQGDDIIGSTLAREVDGDNDSTVWRAMWLTASLVIYAEGVAPREDWDANSLEQGGRAVNGTTVRSWARPLSQLRSISAENVRRTYANMNISTSLTYEADFILDFNDPDADTQLPFPSTYSSGSGKKSGDEFIIELRKAWIAAL